MFYQTFGLETAFVVLAALVAIILIGFHFVVREDAEKSKALLALTLATAFTLNFMFNLHDGYGVKVKQGHAVEVGSVFAGFPARSFELPLEAAPYIQEFDKLPGLKKSGKLSFCFALYDSLGRKGLDLGRAQSFYDSVIVPYGDFSSYFSKKLEKRGVNHYVWLYLTNHNPAHLKEIERIILDVGRPIGLRSVTQVAVTVEGGRS